eukprot:5264194-Lingulodinium_polyedra.AAC.1
MPRVKGVVSGQENRAGITLCQQLAALRGRGDTPGIYGRFVSTRRPATSRPKTAKARANKPLA